MNYTNQLYLLIEKYPDKPWNWEYIFMNPNTTEKEIDKYACHFDSAWYNRTIAFNPNFTIEWVDKYADKMDKDLDFYGANNISPACIEKYPDLNWGWHRLFMETIYLEEMIKKYPKRLDWDAISQNDNFTVEMIEKYMDKPLNWEWLSFNPNITIEWIEKYPDKPWSWNGLSQAIYITIPIIEKYIDKWKWNEMAWANRYITIQIIEKYIDIWDWFELSLNYNFTVEMIEKYADKWDWSCIVSHYKNIMYTDIAPIHQMYGIVHQQIRILLPNLLKNILINHGIGKKYLIMNLKKIQ